MELSIPEQLPAITKMAGAGHNEGAGNLCGAAASAQVQD